MFCPSYATICSMRALLKWPCLSIYFLYYWAKLVMAEMVIGRNGSRPKISSYQQMASDTFILKFALVSEFHRHTTDDRKLRTPFLFA